MKMACERSEQWASGGLQSPPMRRIATYREDAEPDEELVAREQAELAPEDGARVAQLRVHVRAAVLRAGEVRREGEPVGGPTQRLGRRRRVRPCTRRVGGDLERRGAAACSAGAGGGGGCGRVRIVSRHQLCKHRVSLPSGDELRSRQRGRSRGGVRGRGVRRRSSGGSNSSSRGGEILGVAARGEREELDDPVG